MKISVNCPSYKRPKVETLDYLPFCKVWVDNKEYQSYVDANPKFKDNIISVPDGIQGNLCRIRNYILDEELNKVNLFKNKYLNYYGNATKSSLECILKNIGGIKWNKKKP